MLVDGYIRVSQVAGRRGESFLSPQLQREQIERWARLNAALVAELFEELDVSGGRRDRPMFVRSIERVEAGRTNGVVVAKLDRFARSLLDALHAIERIQAAGGTFVSVQDGLDLRTDTGKFLLRVMFSMAELELDRIRSSWNVARQRAIERGVCISQPPVGYLRRDSRLVPDPQVAPLIEEAFRRAARRQSARQVGIYLESQGVRTGKGRAHWAVTSVRGLIANRAYLGEVRSGEYVNEHAHEPLVDASLWRAAQAVDTLAETPGGSTPCLLRGLLRCAGCGRRLVSHLALVKGGSRVRHYYCRGHYSGGACPAKVHVSAAQVEPYVEAVFWQELARRRPRSSRVELERLELAVRKREAALVAYRDNPRIIEAIGTDRFAEGLRKRALGVDRGLLALSAAEARNNRPGSAAARDDLSARWRDLSVVERRAAMAEVIDCAFVAQGRRDFRERVWVCLRGEAPPDLSGPGLHSPVRPFRPEECSGRSPVRLREPRSLWSERRMRQELARFASRREYFPTCEEFQVAGLLALFEQVKLQGGPRRWARELRIEHLPIERNTAGWDADRVRMELTRFLADKDHWPNVNEFEQADQGRLRRALAVFGGAAYWSAEFGLGRPIGLRQAFHHWTPERIEDALMGFLNGRTRWPRDKDFTAAGLGGLHNAIRRNGGKREWAKRVAFTADTTEWIMRRSTPYRRPAVLWAGRAPDAQAKRRVDAVWTRETIADAIRRWTDDHGRTPRASDWSPCRARRPGDYVASHYPATNNVIRTFESWGAALEAAGYDSTRHRGSPLVSVRPDAPVPRFPPGVPD